MNTDLMNQIEAVGSRLEKERLLAQETDTRFLKWALDPIITFGVTADTDAELTAWEGSGQRYPVRRGWWEGLDGLLGELSRRELTGNAALHRVAGTLRSAPARDDVLWACRVINKDLRCGVQVSTANKCFPGLIEPFSVMLSVEYDPEKHGLAGDWIAQPKLDGLRMVVVRGEAWTRNGRKIETVGHILKELTDSFGHDFVFDGEIMGDTDFDADSGRTRRKSTGTDVGLTYNVFDVIPVAHWERKQTAPLAVRMEQLAQLVGGAGLNHVRLVPSFPVPANASLQELSDSFRDKFVAQGYEGAMLKDMMSPYVFKRSDKLLKFKPFQDADGTIVEFQEGKGRHRGRLGALFVEVDGAVTRVGSGFDDGQRGLVWGARDHFMGRTVEVKYQNKTPDGKLRFPVFVRFRGDKD